jgi:hypothetical protein
MCPRVRRDEESTSFLGTQAIFLVVIGTEPGVYTSIIQLSRITFHPTGPKCQAYYLLECGQAVFSGNRPLS